MADIGDGALRWANSISPICAVADGLPDPDRQVVMRRAKGTAFLYVRWDSSGLVMEIDGAQGPSLDDVRSVRAPLEREGLRHGVNTFA